MSKIVTASQRTEAEVDSLYAAAKSVMNKRAQFESMDAEIPAPEGMGEESAEVEIDKAPEGTDSKVQDVARAVADVVDKAEKAEAVVEQVGKVIETIEQAAADAKSALQGAGASMPESTEDSVEIDIDVEDENGAPDINEKKDEIIVESEDKCDKCNCEPCKCEKGEAKEEKTDKEASSKAKMSKASDANEEFCKYAKISPANRKKVYVYWTNMLGYPKDFAALLVKDYEK